MRAFHFLITGLRISELLGEPNKMLGGNLALDYVLASHLGGVAILLDGFMLWKSG